MNDNFFMQENVNSDPMQSALHDGIQLPFPTLFASWHNGKKELAELGTDSVKYAGGWEMSEKYYEGVKDQFPDLPMFKMAAMNGKESYNAYLAKTLIVVPVGIRERSLMKVDGRDVVVKKFTKGARAHMQLLAYLATQNMEPFAPIVLSAKSNSARYIKDAIKLFDDNTKEIRSGVKVPYYRFWLRLGIGTPKFETVGRGDNTSDITPCQLIEPATGWNMDVLKRTYIGQEMIAKIDEMQIASAEWLNDKIWLGLASENKSTDPIPDGADAEGIPDFMR